MSLCISSSIIITPILNQIPSHSNNPTSLSKNPLFDISPSSPFFFFFPYLKNLLYSSSSSSLIAMAENLDDGEFWLPPQFLSDDDNNITLPFDPKNKPLNFPNNVDEALFPSEFPYGFSSELTSPFGGSSETESDEDEHHIAELTRLMARSTLEVDFKNTVKSTGQLVSGSPQSTLCAFGSGCGCRKGSSQGSPNSVCKLSSARATWDLLHAAAGEVERMRLIQEDGYAFNHHNGHFVPQRKPSPMNNNTNHLDVGVLTQQSLSHQQLQLAQFQMLRQQQMAKQQNNSSSVWGVQNHCVGVYPQRQSDNQMVPNSGRNNRPLGLSASAWPSLQHAKQQQNQQYGSSNGMRAVFLGGRRECAGTGVFLPRPAESRKKPTCSTALVPDRVVQALNRKLEDIVGDQPRHLHRFNASSNMENAAVARLRSNYVLHQQKRNLRPHPAVNHEIRLPQEWTY